MNTYIWTAIFLMAIVSFCIRVLPLTIFRKEIKNTFVKSFLYYVPYVTLAVMTFPAIMYNTSTMWSGFIAFIVGIILAWNGVSIFQTSVLCCVVVYIMQLFL